VREGDALVSAKLLQGLLASVTAAFLALLAWQYQWLEGWEYTTWRWRVQHYARPSPVSKHIKLILLDQASLDWGARMQRWPWPWPREAYAALLHFTQRAKAKVVAFDVLFSEDSFYGVADDQALGEVIRQGGNVVSTVFLSTAKSPSGQTADWPSDVALPMPKMEGLQAWLDARATPQPTMTLAAFPVPEVARHSASLGHVVGHPDRDAVIRRVNLFSLFAGRAIPSLGMAAYLVGNPPQTLRLQAGWLHLDDRKVPIDQQGNVILRYRGTTDVYESFSAKDILQSEIRLQSGEPPLIDPSVFADAYVVLGFSAPGLLDLRPTPLSPVAPGAVIYATLIDNLLANDVLRDAPASVVIAFTLLLSVSAAVTITLSRKTWQAIAAFPGFLLLPVLSAFFAYERGYWLPLVTPALATGVALATGIIINYITEGRQRAYIRNAFEHYLSPMVIQQLLDDPSRLQLGGERRDLSIMFTDLQGFSSISERMNPQSLIGLLNDFLSDMTSIILAEGGTLDKYEGDAIIAFWNAPIEQPDHAVRACRAALRCQRKLADRRQELYERTGAKLYMRIGLNSGEVVVGNMGSHERFDYTMLGDNANLAARLEGANKVFGTYFMVSESTWNQSQHAFIGREIAAIRVVGRNTPVTVYEILGFAGEVRPGYLDLYENALRFYTKGELKEALQLFEQLPDDALAQAYAARCREALATPSGDWDLVWNLTSK
jgi:adenylate cyclase